MDVIENVAARNGSEALTFAKGFLIARSNPNIPGAFIVFRSCDAAKGHWSSRRMA